jgi:hypothetical protein
VASDQTRKVLAGKCCKPGKPGKGCKPGRLMQKALIPGGQKIRDTASAASRVRP